MSIIVISQSIITSGIVTDNYITCSNVKRLYLMTFFHMRICCKICNVFEKTKINEKETGLARF